MKLWDKTSCSPLGNSKVTEDLSVLSLVVQIPRDWSFTPLPPKLALELPSEIEGVFEKVYPNKSPKSPHSSIIIIKRQKSIKDD